MKSSGAFGIAVHSAMTHPVVAGVGAAVAGVALITLAVTIGVPTGAQGANSMRIPEPDDSALSPRRRVAFAGLHGLVGSCVALIDSPNIGADGRQALVLWASDRRDRGRVNPEELLVLVHSPLLRTLEALATIEGAGVESDSPLEPADLFSAGMVTAWRAHPDVSSRVIATDVTDFRVKESGRSSKERLISVELTFALPSSDETESATFHVRLPAVQQAAGRS